MNLILWRHAEAEEGDNDLKRALTRRGLKQAAAMADWLRQHAPEGAGLLASNALRSQQTAAALSSRFKAVKGLDPDRGVEELLAAVEWPEGGGESGCVIAVGHQPTLGRTAALLLGGAEADWTIKKGAIWWFTNRVRAEETQTVLRVALAAEFLL
jgi:phosphohistidine phosphatase